MSLYGSWDREMQEIRLVNQLVPGDFQVHLLNAHVAHFIAAKIETKQDNYQNLCKLNIQHWKIPYVF
jgi:hypothetical protein